MFAVARTIRDKGLGSVWIRESSLGRDNNEVNLGRYKVGAIWSNGRYFFFFIIYYCKHQLPYVERSRDI